MSRFVIILSVDLLTEDECFAVWVVFCIVISATLGLQVSIPQPTYEVARGDAVIITCSFQPKNPVNRLIVVSWTGEPDGSFDDEGV